MSILPASAWSGDDGGQPERGRHVGQPVGGAVGLGRALRCRAGPRDLSGCRSPAPRRRRREPRGRRTVPSSARATCAPAIGSWPTTASWRAMPAQGSTPKTPAARRVAGTPAARLDLPDKVFGRPRFVHDLALPGLLHGRVLKPASPGAKLTSLDKRCARDCRYHCRSPRRQLRRGRRRDGKRGGSRARRPAQGARVERRRGAA